MVNKIVLQGRLTRDPELKYTLSEIARMEFTLAWSEKYKEVEKKCFLRCVAWRETAKFIHKYFRKGQELLIEGQMYTDEREDHGEKKSRTLCQVDKAHFCGPKRDDAEPRMLGEPDADGFFNVPEGIDNELPFD